ncbi:LysR family transcriptional regulator [Pigmentiphaga sp. H8]|uniref:LysR family transcriptional regulator n=1 Tax=unclassified Pigmentiphaga TaxID=2626614 RepID=UPI000F5A4C99|nr:LysR family transcriptional regulator [Pigmentiphaga sp. H8]AZG06701.1 LysR family transcriptional regulator [Pigmentiphaga sp. H8]
MPMSLRQLRIFVAVAKTGSTMGAASEIALSQSAVSAALNELEGLLHTRLFDRVGKRLILNDNGRGLLAEATALLDNAQQIERGFFDKLGHAAATLKLGCSTTIGNYVLPGLLARYRLRAPHTPIEVTIANTAQVSAAVAGFDVDMGLIEGPCQDADIQPTPWLLDEMVIVCSARHPLASEWHTRRITREQLRESRWLLRERGSGSRLAVEQALLPYLHQLNMDIELGSTEAIKYAAAEGLWLACLSRCAVKDMVAAGQLSILDTDLPPLTRRFYLIHHKKKFLSDNLKDFFEHCRGDTVIQGA